MPYTIQKNDEGEHCVHKKNPDGSVGPLIGKGACHKTIEEAQAQIGAISENEKKSVDVVDHPYGPVNIYVNHPPMTDTANTSNTISVLTDVFSDIAGKNDMKKSTDNVDDKPLEEPVEEPTEEPVEEPVTEPVEEPAAPEIDPLYTVKALGEKRLGGYGILWGDEENKDLHGEWFDPETRDIKAIFDAMGKVPLIVHHAADDEVKTFVYGEVDVMEEDERGVWWEAKIKEFEVYREYVEPLLKRRAMFSSTGTLPAAKRRTKSGQITRWPVAEMTTTWIPAEWRMLERPVDEIKAAYKAIDLNCDLSEYDDEQEKETEGAEKARLKAIVQLHLSELELLDLE